jgi:hypothetical protein
VVLALIAALLLLVSLTGLPDASEPGGGAATETVVYRIDGRNADGNFTVYEWGTASGPHRTAVVQTRKRQCQQQSAAHACRATSEATLTDRRSADDHRRTQCRNYRADHGRLPAGMTSC